MIYGASEERRIARQRHTNVWWTPEREICAVSHPQTRSPPVLAISTCYLRQTPVKDVLAGDCVSNGTKRMQLPTATLSKTRSIRMSLQSGPSHPSWGTQISAVYVAVSNDWPHVTQSTAYKPSRCPRTTVELDIEVYACLHGP